MTIHVTVPQVTLEHFVRPTSMNATLIPVFTVTLMAVKISLPILAVLVYQAIQVREVEQPGILLL